jgi:hypothetical protein
MEKILYFDQFITEQYSESEYDRILDLYNLHGEKGMSKEEISYLKSGGTSRIPNKRSDNQNMEKEAFPGVTPEIVRSLTNKPPEEFFEVLRDWAASGDFKTVASLIRTYIEMNMGIYKEEKFIEALSQFMKEYNLEPPSTSW